MQGGNRDTDVENELMDMRGVVGESGTRWGGSIDIYMLPGITQLASGQLLCSTRSPARSSVMTWEGGKGEQGRGSRGRGYMYK